MKAARFSALALLFSARLFSAAAPVSFSKDIQPILQNSCWKCHGSAMQLSKLDLRTRESALKGGDHGPAIVPGNPAQSRLVRMISGEEKPAMPMGGTLTPEQVATLKSWIEQGAVWDSTARPIPRSRRRKSQPSKTCPFRPRRVNIGRSKARAPAGSLR
ncbi:MAG: hypothetical protein M3Z23_07025 [Acidobacteriota bacterium]|nr:hypothetical protein [Acidobacteriota bacterium]